jgi:hypothetical protein
MTRRAPTASSRARSLLKAGAGPGLRGSRTALGFAVTAAASAWIALWVSDRHDAAQEPAHIAVMADLNDMYANQPYDWTAYSFVIDRPVARLPAPPRGFCRTWWAWAQGFDAVDANTTRMRIILQGTSKTAIVLTGARVRVGRRDAPLRGTTATCSRGGAAVNPRHIAVDLDTSVATLDGGDANQPFTFSLHEGDVEAFDVTAYTERCDCRWWLELTYIQDGATKAMSIGSRKDPFRTSAATRAQPVSWTGGRWAKAPRTDQQRSG